MKNRFVFSFIIAIILVSATSGCVGTTNPVSGPDKVQIEEREKIEAERFQKIYAVPTGAKLMVENSNGAVKIGVWDEKVVEVYAVKKSYYGKDELEKVHVEVDTDTDFVIKTHMLATDPKPRVWVDYDIRIPRDLIVDSIASSNGGITLVGTKGDTTLTTSNGRIDVNNVDGYVNAITSNSEITIYDTTGIQGAMTTNSGIIAEIMNINQNIDIITSNGAIELYLSPDLNANIEMEDTNGKIFTHDTSMHLDKYSTNHVQGRVGDGGNNIFVETMNSNIDVYGLE